MVHDHTQSLVVLGVSEPFRPFGKNVATIESRLTCFNSFSYCSRLTYESNTPETGYPVLPTPFVEPLCLQLENAVIFGAQPLDGHSRHSSYDKATIDASTSTSTYFPRSPPGSCFVNRLHSSVTDKHHSTLVTEWLKGLSSVSCCADASACRH
jgi:hypothetical protein